MDNKFDVVVIGGGPAGYVAAIRSAQNGLSTACIDAWENPGGPPAFGGTCLNAGCIPSKALLESSELYHRACNELGNHGIKIADVSLDLDAMQERKINIVQQLTDGIHSLFEANGVRGLHGRGQLLPNNQVQFTSHGGDTELIEGQNIILATGSTPIELPSIPFDGKQIVDSWGALEFDKVPQRLGVIGAGVIGLELGSVWNRLGSSVAIVEALDQFLPMVDGQIAREAQRQFKRQGLDIRLGAMVRGMATDKSGLLLQYDDQQGSHEIAVDKVVVAVGRRPYTDGLLDPLAGIELDDRGFIVVDESCRSSVPNVYAVGDVVRGPMLAHKGSEEGIMVADLIAGNLAEVNYDVVPSVIYTAPEIAWVGKTEEELQSAGVSFKSGTFSFAASGRAKAMDQAAGMTKILASRETDRILGVHIVGPMAGELIGEAVLAMEFQASTEDLQRTIHGHPTLTEAVHEAALAVDRRAIHAINR